MSVKVDYKKHVLKFKSPGGTSRGVLTNKTSYIIRLSENGMSGYGECSLIKGLSPDDENQLYGILNGLKHNLLKPDLLRPQLESLPALRFALEMASLDLSNQGKGIYYDSAFTQGHSPISINGLVWMGSKKFMLEQIEEKINQGYTCIKLKIGAINWQAELDLLKHIRKHFNPNEIEIRVDSNGAFSANDVMEKLEELSKYQLHSIEQPIQPGQWDEMSRLCELSPLAIALDEELISITDTQERRKLLSTIRPQFIILKPSLVGGFAQSEEWIKIADEMKIKWWATSALESNVGLNAIAQWVATKNNHRPQGLGTGKLFTNNIPSPLYIHNGQLSYNPEISSTNFLKEYFSDDV